MSWSSMVGPDWPRPLTSTMPTSVSTRSRAASCTASHTDLAVTHEHECPRIGAGKPRAECKTEPDPETLAERAGRDVDERQPRCGMSLEVAVHLPQLRELIAVHQAHRRPRRVQQRRGVALAQHEAI